MQIKQALELLNSSKITHENKKKGINQWKYQNIKPRSPTAKKKKP